MVNRSEEALSHFDMAGRLMPAGSQRGAAELAVGRRGEAPEADKPGCYQGTLAFVRHCLRAVTEISPGYRDLFPVFANDKGLNSAAVLGFAALFLGNVAAHLATTTDFSLLSGQEQGKVWHPIFGMERESPARSLRTIDLPARMVRPEFLSPAD